MKHTLTVVLAAAALAATWSPVAAGSLVSEPVTAADALPAYEILTTIRTMGLDPISAPVRRGPYYVLHAYDPRGLEVRVVADAQFGDILSIAPARARNSAYAPRYSRGPRIIHVPEGDEREAALPNDDDAQGRSDTSPLPRTDPRRAVARPSPRGSLTPIYPTPRFHSKAE